MSGGDKGRLGWRCGVSGCWGWGLSPHPASPPHLWGRGRMQLPARACIPGIWQRRAGGPAASPAL